MGETHNSLAFVVWLKSVLRCLMIMSWKRQIVRLYLLFISSSDSTWGWTVFHLFSSKPPMWDPYIRTRVACFQSRAPQHWPVFSKWCHYFRIHITVFKSHDGHIREVHTQQKHLRLADMAIVGYKNERAGCFTLDRGYQRGPSNRLNTWLQIISFCHSLITPDCKDKFSPWKEFHSIFAFKQFNCFIFVRNHRFPFYLYVTTFA